MSGFEQRSRATNTGDAVIGEFTGVTEPIEKGDIIVAGGGALRAAAANIALGATEKIISDPEIMPIEGSNQVGLVYRGEFSDGTIVCSHGGSTSRLSLSVDTVVCTIKDGEIITKKKLSTTVACIYVDPIQDRICVCEVGITTTNSRDTFRFKIYDKDLELLKQCADLICPSANSCPSSADYAKMIFCGNGVVIMMIAAGASNNSLGCLVYDTDTETKYRDPISDGLLSGISYYSQINTNQTQGEDAIWLNSERTRCVIPYFVYTSGTYWGYILCDASDDEVATCLKGQLSTNHPNASLTNMINFSLAKNVWGRPNFRHGCKRGGSVEGFLIPNMSSQQTTWHVYSTAGNTFDLQGAYGTHYSTGTNMTVMFTSGKYFYEIFYYTSAFYVICLNMETGSVLYSSSVQGGVSAWYSHQPHVTEDDGEGNVTIYVPMSTETTTYNDNNFYMGKFTVSPNSANCSLKSFEPSVAGTGKGQLKGCEMAGKYIVIFNGSYSDGSYSANFWYHLFDTETDSWVDETENTDTMIRVLTTGSEDYWSGTYYTSRFLTSQRIGYNGIMLFGFGLLDSSLTYHVDSQLFVLDVPMFLGVATTAQSGGKLSVMLQGSAVLHEKYAKIFKQIDHSAMGGNTGAVFGSVAILKGV